MIGAVTVAFGFSIALAENSVYEISCRLNYCGFYVETENPLSFVNVDNEEFRIYFSNDTNSWKLDNRKLDNRKLFNRTTLLQADGNGDKPPETGWQDVNKNENVEEALKLISALASTFNETRKDKGSATLDGGVLCLDQKNKWIMLTGNDTRICDGNTTCQGGWDEVCLGREFNGTENVVISGGDPRTRGVYNLTRRSNVPLFYSRFDGWGFVRW